MKKKKLMILCGLRYVLPVIKVAHSLGLHVITADYLPDNVADYLGVSIDYLVRGLEGTNGAYGGMVGFVAEEKEIIDAYRKLSRKRQEMILNLLHDFAKVEKIEKVEKNAVGKAETDFLCLLENLINQIS